MDLSQLPFETIAIDAEIITGDLRLRGRAARLSRTGMAFEAERPLTVSTCCELELALVFSESHSSEPISLRGSVVWCSRLGDRYQIGVQFAKPDPQLAQHLELFVGLLDELELAPVAPSRAPFAHDAVA